MTYDEDLADRVRELIASEAGVTEKRMFGGLAFLIGGNLSVSASRQGGLLLRCEPAETDALLRKPSAQPFEMRGRVMEGWLRVDANGLRTKRQLERWVGRGVAYARSQGADVRERLNDRLEIRLPGARLGRLIGATGLRAAGLG